MTAQPQGSRIGAIAGGVAATGLVALVTLLILGKSEDQAAELHPLPQGGFEQIRKDVDLSDIGKPVETQDFSVENLGSAGDRRRMKIVSEDERKVLFYRETSPRDVWTNFHFWESSVGKYDQAGINIPGSLMGEFGPKLSVSYLEGGRLKGYIVVNSEREFWGRLWFKLSDTYFCSFERAPGGGKANRKEIIRIIAFLDSTT